MKTRNGLVFVLLFILGTFLIFGGGKTSFAKEKTFVTIATAGVGGIWYTIGGGMVEVVNKSLPDFKASSQATGASVENLRLLNAKSVDFGMWGAATAWKSRQGLEPFRKAIKDPRSAGIMFNAVFQVIIKKKHGVNSFKALKGKKISAGGLGSGSWANALIVLPMLGVDKKNMVAIGYRAANDAFKDDRIDAMMQLGGYPFPNLAELATTEDVVFISMTEGQRDQIIKKYPFYTKHTIPPGTYKGQDYGIVSLSDPCIFGTRADMPKDVVYKVVKAIYSKEGISYLRKVHTAIKPLTLENALGWSMQKQMYPLHPGAIKYYKELAKQLGKEWKPAE